MTTALQKHVAFWSQCARCGLCKTRKHVVLVRGTIPCDILFIGEAPGKSEDILGTPFIGPAGHLLDSIIKDAFTQYYGGEYNGGVPTIAFTNLVCCIPLGDGGDKISEPPTEAIKACAPRLKQLIQLCNPQVIVTVGDLAKTWLSKLFTLEGVKTIHVTHPAAILRANIAQRGLMIQRCVVTLANVVGDLIPF